MSKPVVFSSITKIHSSPAVPARWIDCPRKSTIIADKFIAFKTPLDDQYKKDVGKGKQWTCSMLIQNLKDDHRNLGLVIDLTNTDRYYQGDVEFTAKNICYKKIPCQGHNEPPTDDQINQFSTVCRDFIRTNPNDVIGVHCTHGFNRTGFLICAYLSQAYNYRIDTAIDLFATKRSPGIYKQDYLDALARLSTNPDMPAKLAPSSPAWCQTTASAESTPLKRVHDNMDVDQSKKRWRSSGPKSYRPKFAVDIPNVVPVENESTLNHVRSKCQQMCQWNRQSFPGSQPVSMDATNHALIFQTPYMVSWKADGTRYMMLIEDKDHVYMLDRNNDAFQIHQLFFPETSHCTQYLTNTLVDGEFVIDHDKGVKIYRYLIYDVVIYNNMHVGAKPFTERQAILEQIVGVRNEAIGNGRLNKSLEPFSLRPKPFYDLSQVSALLGKDFQSQITHGCDGLVFQPVNDPYRSGRSERVLKWKEDDTIDFRLKITRDRHSHEKRADLYVGRKAEPYDSMPYSPQLEQYDNQIIECSKRHGEWSFYRHRVDKTYPNAEATADAVKNALEHRMEKILLCSLVEEHVAFSNY